MDLKRLFVEGLLQKQCSQLLQSLLLAELGVDYHAGLQTGTIPTTFVTSVLIYGFCTCPYQLEIL